MDMSKVFKVAHSRTRIKRLEAVCLGKEFSYKVTFAIELKKAIAKQTMKLVTLKGSERFTTYLYSPKKKVNKCCAMVGDYKLGNTLLDESQSIKSLFLSVVAIIIIYAITVQAIINL